MARRSFRHALVAGGSIAGLLAARALSDHFDHVTLIERDALTLIPEPRKGVPQGCHVHILLRRGRQILDSLFPSLSGDLCSAGAVSFDFGRELAAYNEGGWATRYDSDLIAVSMSRPLLEAKIAERVSLLPNVTVLGSTWIEGLRIDGSGAVTGARVRALGHHGQAREIEADLLVDATGRGSLTPSWLAALGYRAPQTELLPARVAYASCLFQRSAQWPGWHALLAATSNARRIVGVLPIERDRWLVTLASFFDEPTPRDHDTFLACAEALPVPDVCELIRGSAPLSQVMLYRFPGSQRRQYEQLDRFPEGLIVFGDAVCSFNPVYAQGMSVSAIEAEFLGQLLAETKSKGGLALDFSRRWFCEITPAIDTAWNGASMEDLHFAELAEQRPIRMRPLQWYLRRVKQASHHSPAVADQFYRVIHLLDPPSALLRPRVLTDVLFGRFSAVMSLPNKAKMLPWKSSSGEVLHEERVGEKPS